MVIKTKHTLFVLLIFTLSMFLFCSCSEPYDPAVVPETEIFSPIDIEDTVVTETYNMFKVRFADANDRGDLRTVDTNKDLFLNTYRTYCVTEKELTNQNKLFAIFSPIQADEIKQTWAYEQIDEPTLDYDGRVYYLETEQVEQMARELFGKAVNLTHEWPVAAIDKFLPSFNNGRYEWRDPNWGGDPVSWYFHVLISAEKSGNYLIIYDKYINGIPVDDDEIGLFYGDSEFVNSIEIPDEYKRNDYLLDYEKKDEVVLKYGTPYKHTFKLAEDGTYFWVSSEPINED